MNNKPDDSSVARSGPGTGANDGGEERKAMAFEQQPRESEKAFAAFKTYLELGPERSLALVGDDRKVS